jgi:hypothetical protein
LIPVFSQWIYYHVTKTVSDPLICELGFAHFALEYPRDYKSVNTAIQPRYMTIVFDSRKQINRWVEGIISFDVSRLDGIPDAKEYLQQTLMRIQAYPGYELLKVHKKM